LDKKLARQLLVALTECDVRTRQVRITLDRREFMVTPLEFSLCLRISLCHPYDRRMIKGIKAVSIDVAGVVFRRPSLLLSTPSIPFKATIKPTAFGFIDPYQQFVSGCDVSRVSVA
jgi:hypothetical protein